MEGLDSNAAIALVSQDPGEDSLAEFLRTGRVAGGPECCAFLRELFGDIRSQPTRFSFELPAKDGMSHGPQQA